MRLAQRYRVVVNRDGAALSSSEDPTMSSLYFKPDVARFDAFDVYSWASWPRDASYLASWPRDASAKRCLFVGILAERYLLLDILSERYLFFGILNKMLFFGILNKMLFFGILTERCLCQEMPLLLQLDRCLFFGNLTLSSSLTLNQLRVAGWTSWGGNNCRAWLDAVQPGSSPSPEQRALSNVP